MDRRCRAYTMTNAEFGQRIGVGHSMASRIRNGQRLPGTRTLARIHEEFGIDLLDLHDAHRAGPDAFGALMRERVTSVVKIAGIAA